MNFLQCRLVREAESLSLLVTDKLKLQVPADRNTRYEPFIGRDLVLGIRPEHVHETRASGESSAQVMVNFIEPLGMETMVYFSINGVEACGRVSPEADPRQGHAAVLSFDAEKSHLIDPESDQVL